MIGSRKRIRELFEAAVELPPWERAPFLERECGADRHLYRRVTRLLEADRSHYPSGVVDALSTVAQRMVGAPFRRRRPERLGPWIVEKELGRGGMGAVFEARRENGDGEERAAAKVLWMIEDEESLWRFRRERRLLARVDHPHVARWIDDGELADGTPYLVMELVRGGERIDVYCDRHRLSLEDRLVLFSQTCDAIAAAHREQIVHRDLKPSNILVGQDGELKVVDFGIAKALGDEQSVTSHHSPMTPNYASPEAIRGEPTTKATDVYALGLLLYVLMSGHNPQKKSGASDWEIMDMICGQEVLPPSRAVAGMEASRAARVARRRGLEPEELKRRLAGNLDRIILEALRKSPAERPDTVESLMAALKRLGPPFVGTTKTAPSSP